MNRQTDVTMRLSRKLLGGREVRRVAQLSPESDAVQLEFQNKPDGVYVTIPELDIWSLLKPECDQTTPRREL